MYGNRSSLQFFFSIPCCAFVVFIISILQLGCRRGRIHKKKVRQETTRVFEKGKEASKCVTKQKSETQEQQQKEQGDIQKKKKKGLGPVHWPRKQWFFCAFNWFYFLSVKNCMFACFCVSSVLSTN
jgi:mannitol-specific phosphotransferase system IIBC component